MNVFRYVRHHDIKAYEADGWVVVDDLAAARNGRHGRGSEERSPCPPTTAARKGSS